MNYHGPSLARWLFEQPEVRALDDSRRRTIRHWANGVHPKEEAVDQLLCEVGLHLREVPASAVTGWPEVAVRGLEVEWNLDGSTYLRRAA